jgi:NAD(P)-dependent dehydrogenase (short-subunit alcohol dehydrogenase family)
MDLKLKGKRALVTGSTAGIGFAIASALAQEHAEVIVNGRSEVKVAEAVKRIGAKTGAQASGIAADLGSADGAAKLAERAGRIDILVNNVGIFEPVPFLDITDGDWLRLFEVNVMSGVRLTRALLPAMLDRNWGRVIFISSESGVHIPPEMVHYGVTKTAQIALARGIAESIPGTGVTVNSVLAGPTRSDGAVEFLGKVAAERGTEIAAIEAEFLRTMRASSLIRRFAEPEEVANLVTFLAGEGSSAITGAALRVDGGVVRSVV